MTLDLERRIRRATPRDVHRRRIAVAEYRRRRAAALADPNCSKLTAARYGAEMTSSALAIVAGVSRDTVRRAEAATAEDNRLSAAVWRRLATALGCRIEDIRP